MGGWSLSGFLEYAGGTPRSVAPGFSPIPGMGNRVFINSYENWRGPVSGDKFDPFKDRWWDSSAFQIGPDGKQLTQAQLNAGIGNATALNPKERSPWMLNENLAVAKNMNITEKVKFTLRAEAFNVLNRVRWGGPDSNVTSVNFGIIRSQGNDPRRMQFGAKVVF